MEESQKLVMLKKAYADMILSSAKEAAARVMASDRRASNYQKELLMTKEEAVRLLLRLKHMSDAKMSETETTMRSQQKKIEELEAQLQEAERVIKEQREELKEVQDLTTNRSCQLLKECASCFRTKPGDLVTGSRPGISMSGSHAHATSRNECGVSGTNMCHERTCNGGYCNFASKEENYDHSAYHRSEAKGYCNVNGPSFESGGLRCKESKFCRHKCMEGMQEFERKPCCSGSTKCDHILGGVMNNRKKTGTVVGMDAQFELEETQDEAKMVDANVTGVIGSSVTKKKRSARHRKQKTPSSSEMHGLDGKKQQTWGIHCFNTLTTEPVTKPVVHAATHVMLINGLIGAANNGEALMLDAKQDSVVNEALNGVARVNSCKASNSLPKIEKQNSTLAHGVPSMSSENKFLKYTFQRKRKKEPLLSLDGTRSIHGMTSEQKQCYASLEEEKISPTCNKSQDSEQIIQVAHQLMSLSEKK